MPDAFTGLSILAYLAWPVAERLGETDVRYLTLAAAALARRSGPCPDTEAISDSPLRLCDDCPKNLLRCLAGIK